MENFELTVNVNNLVYSYKCNNTSKRAILNKFIAFLNGFEGDYFKNEHTKSVVTLLKYMKLPYEWYTASDDISDVNDKQG